MTADRDAEREQLAALLIALWEEDAGESLDGLDGVSEAIDAYLARLLPVVDRIANERAAAALESAADGTRPDLFAGFWVDAERNVRTFLRDRAAGLRADGTTT